MRALLRHALLLLAVAFATGCGTNPVTKKKEIQFVSESQEIAIGQKNYAPARQSQGGDYVLDAELTEYVRGIGNKIAAVSDRNLPYEFVLLNESVPNAWAMPGGKIAVNRGLLYELKSEAELAAVIGHEIVHAAARHGAKSMERGILLQGAILAVGLGTANSDYSQLFVQGAQVAAQLTATKYGRDAELESDFYGMNYMKKAGYDPRAAIGLQETFVRLSQGRKSSFLEGLFASHPPSEERVARNRESVARLGEGGFVGEEVYQQKTAYLRKTKPAYDAHQEAVRALAKGDKATASSKAAQAIALEPREARFVELLGDIEMSQGRFADALGYYGDAIRLQADYFKPHVQSGIALYELKRNDEAEAALQRSVDLLPTAPGHYFLGLLREERGDIQGAMPHFQAAAGAQSELGQRAAARYVKYDITRNRDRYLQSGVQAQPDGTLLGLVRNASPVPLTDITVRLVRVENNVVVGQSAAVKLPNPLKPGEVGKIAMARVQLQNEAQLQAYRLLVESARVVEQ